MVILYRGIELLGHLANPGRWSEHSQQLVEHGAACSCEAENHAG